MGQPASATVDVRDMLCAQALALTDQAMRRLAPGEAIEVVTNSADVREDLAAWSRQLGHAVAHSLQEADQVRMLIRKAG